MAILPVDLQPHQEAFLFSTAKYLGLYGGVGNGKTRVAILRCLMLADMYPGNVIIVGRKFSTELEKSTQADFLEIVKERNGGTLDEGQYVRKYLSSKPAYLYLKTYDKDVDSKIIFQKLETDADVLSMNVGAVYVDQAEFITEATNGALETRVRMWGPNEVRSFIEKYHSPEWLAKIPEVYQKAIPRDLMFITGNPAPGWVYNRYKAKVYGNQYVLIEAKTDANAKNLPKNYISDLRKNHSEEWVARYLDGSWDTWAGQIYKDYRKDLHTVPVMEIPDYWPRYIGWDHGTTNPTAVCVVCVDSEGNVLVYREYYKSDASIKAHAKAVLDLLGGDAGVPRTDTGGLIVWMDPSVKGDKDTDGRDFRQLYNELGIHGIPANNRVLAGIGKVVSLLKPDPGHKFPAWHPRAGQAGSPKLFFMEGRCPAGQHEIELYHWKPRPEGTLLNALEEPEKYLDHFMDALRYAIMAVFDKAILPTEDKQLDPFGKILMEKMGVVSGTGVPTEFW